VTVGRDLRQDHRLGEVALVGREPPVEEAVEDNTNGAVGGTQILDPTLLAATMQKTASDRGVVTSSTDPLNYNNGVWAKNFTPAKYPQLTCSFWVPFMSGYGGITSP
jgi:hypothetical protein